MNKIIWCLVPLLSVVVVVVIYTEVTHEHKREWVEYYFEQLARQSEIVRFQVSRGEVDRGEAGIYLSRINTFCIFAERNDTKCNSAQPMLDEYLTWEKNQSEKTTEEFLELEDKFFEKYRKIREDF